MIQERSTNKGGRWTAHTVEQIREWTDEELTDLNWVHTKVYWCGGEQKMQAQNWKRTMNKRINQVRFERGLDR